MTTPSRAGEAFLQVPVVDVASLRGDDVAARSETASAMHAACRDVGFMYVVGHGVPQDLVQELEATARDFFAQPMERKLEIPMSRGGIAWRGYFAPEDELTSGVPDLKEGLYFGQDLGPEHPLVAAGTPMHGRNLFPDEPRDLKRLVSGYIDAMTELGHVLLRGLALGLGLDAGWFASDLCKDALTLFRIFNYPADPRAHLPDRWGVGEHTDYGLITMLHQDACGGLEVRNHDDVWVAAPPIPGSFVVNIGDMLERLTGGLYRSTPHRVRNTAARDRISFPFFFDPGWTAAIRPIPLPAAAAAELEARRHRLSAQQASRWDHTNLLDDDALVQTYGQYLLGKVGKVFPDLANQVVAPSKQQA